MLQESIKSSQPNWLHSSTNRNNQTKSDDVHWTLIVYFFNYADVIAI